MPMAKRRSAGFTLVELLVVVGIIGALASIAMPSLQRARAAAVEAGVAADLRTMATTQELFFPNPVPVPPPRRTSGTPRYARLHELNNFANGRFGATTRTYYIYKGPVRFSMVPLRPSDTLLAASYRIEARGTGLYNFIYSVDQSGSVVKIR